MGYLEGPSPGGAHRQYELAHFAPGSSPAGHWASVERVMAALAARREADRSCLHGLINRGSHLGHVVGASFFTKGSFAHRVHPQRRMPDVAADVEPGRSAPQ